MELELKEMSYGLLLFYTFLGLLLGIEALITFHLFTLFHIMDFLSRTEGNTVNLILRLIITFVFVTIVGFIVDSFIFKGFERATRDSCQQ
jgi:H+/Cl- antiporter ClcA